MKKTLCAVASLAIFPSFSNAQSSVTLYGVVDAGFTYTSNAGGHSQYQLASGNFSGSRWGLRGTEDLGGAVKAIFVLENGFSVMNGKLSQGGDEFGRQGYVGLSHPTLGTIILGRQYDSLTDFAGPFSAVIQWASNYGAHPGDEDNLDGTNRVNNAVKYRSVDYNGFSFGGLYSVGGVTGQFNRNQIWSVGAAYSTGPLSMGVAYLNAKDPNFSFFGNNATSSTTGSNMTASRLYSGYASAKTQQIFAAGASYKISAATVSAIYSNTQFKDIGSEPGLSAPVRGGDAKFHNAEVNLRYAVTPSFQVGLAYDYTQGYGVNDAKYQQGVVGADYILSKRTDAYFACIYQHASGTDSTGARAVANITLVSASSTQNQVLSVVGIRHKF